MSRTKIEWTDATWNPVTGCTKVSRGCEHCYAERMSKRLAGRCGYPKDDPFRVTLHPDRLTEPRHWKKPRRVFVCSMGDLFHEDVPSWFIQQVFDVGWECKRRCLGHVFQFLTKRPQRMATEYRKWLDSQSASFGPFYHWLGTSIEDQATADERIRFLMQCPAAVRFVSYEPALGPVEFKRIWPRDSMACVHCEQVFGANVGYETDITSDGEEFPICPNCGEDNVGGYPSFGLIDVMQLCDIPFPNLDWVIAGGESGPGARPAHPDWFRTVRDQCVEAGTPFFFKQWGEWVNIPPVEMQNTAGRCSYAAIAECPET